jgi:hypothetical protein
MAEEEPPLPSDEIANAADEKGIRRQKTKSTRAKNEAAEFWKLVFESPVGRREMWGILQNGDAFGERYKVAADGSYDPVLAARHAGEQALAFRLYLTWMKFAPGSVALMVQENDPQMVAQKRRR